MYFLSFFDTLLFRKLDGKLIRDAYKPDRAMTMTPLHKVVQNQKVINFH